MKKDTGNQEEKKTKTVDNELAIIIQKNIIYYMDKAGFKDQQTFGVACGYNPNNAQSRVSRYVNRYRSPGKKTLQLFAQVLGVTVEMLTSRRHDHTVRLPATEASTSIAGEPDLLQKVAKVVESSDAGTALALTQDIDMFYEKVTKEAELKENIEKIQADIRRLLDSHEKLSAEVESLKREKTSVEKENGYLKETIAEREKKIEEQNRLMGFMSPPAALKVRGGK